MSSTPDPRAGSAANGRIERMVLAALAALLAVLLLWLRGGVQPESSLAALARRSLDLPVALANGRPTMVEFYADWCSACRHMAPAMEGLERNHQGSLDVVLLNVDNPRWAPELDRYGVNGIPHLQLFDAAGNSVGQAIGLRTPGELDTLALALLQGKPLPPLAGLGATSPLDGAAAATPRGGGAVSPRSHG